MCRELSATLDAFELFFFLIGGKRYGHMKDVQSHSLDQINQVSLVLKMNMRERKEEQREREREKTSLLFQMDLVPYPYLIHIHIAQKHNR